MRSLLERWLGYRLLGVRMTPTTRPNPNHRRRDDVVPAATPEEIARKRAAIREGLDELDAGKRIPLEEIEAWVEAWDEPGEMPRPEPRRRNAR